MCSHKILFKKLHASGITGTPLLWFINYLTNRKQIVDINGNLSETLAITIGVLQGSTLGPTLFLIYINDLPHSTLLLTLMFADDTFCADSDTNIAHLINRANAEIKKLQNGSELTKWQQMYPKQNSLYSILREKL